MSRQVIAALALMVPVMVAPAVLVWLEISGIFNKIKKPWSLLLLRGWDLLPIAHHEEATPVEVLKAD